MQLHLIRHNTTVFETIQFHFLPFVLTIMLLCIMLYTWKWGGVCVGWKWGGMRLKKPLPITVHHATYTPVYANPTSLNKEEEGRMVKDTDAGDGVSVKTPGGRQRETTSLLTQECG